MEIKHKAKRLDNGEWVEGYYFYDYGHDSHNMMTNEVGIFNAGFKPPRNAYGITMVDIDPSTVCALAKHNKLGELWEGDYFWDSISLGTIGVIKYDDSYCRWIVDIVPNVIEGETSPDFSDIIETFDLVEYEGKDYNCIFRDLIGNIHDKGEEQ